MHWLLPSPTFRLTTLAVVGVLASSTASASAADGVCLCVCVCVCVCVCMCMCMCARKHPPPHTHTHIHTSTPAVASESHLPQTPNFALCLLSLWSALWSAFVPVPAPAVVLARTPADTMRSRQVVGCSTVGAGRGSRSGRRGGHPAHLRLHPRSRKRPPQSRLPPACGHGEVCACVWVCECVCVCARARACVCVCVCYQLSYSRNFNKS